MNLIFVPYINAHLCSGIDDHEALRPTHDDIELYNDR